MLTLYIRNMKTKKGIADYEYIVMVNAECIARGSVKGHKRSDGWRTLVKRIAEEDLLSGSRSRLVESGNK